MIMNTTKQDYFEYIIEKLAEKNKDLSSYTTLKSLKLLFFVVAISESTEGNLLSIFDKFYAMPYGPVESDVYDSLFKNELKKYKISSSGCDIKNDRAIIEIEEQEKIKIDNSINNLLMENPDILNYTPFKLVDLSHKWSCWKICFAIALNNSKTSIFMPSDSIRNSVKYYKL